MAAVNRRPPLVPRPLSLQIPAVVSPLKRSVLGAPKRARSPDTAGDGHSKRAKGGPPSPGTLSAREEERQERERRKTEREAQKEEFRIKYTRAFPSWVFYFDLDLLDPDSASAREYLEAKVSQLGGRIDDFFSNEITHLVTNSAIPSEDATGNKENITKSRLSQAKPGSLLKSPIKLKSRSAEDASNYDILIKKAVDFGMKIWSTAKLESVLERCLISGNVSTTASQKSTTTIATPPKTTTSQQRSLTRLLESERLHGTTTERDPTQKRHDFRYFSRSSCFVLVEDMRQELATIHALEYPITNGRDGVDRAAWPVLHCHPQARGPFLEFDDKEKKRWEKSQKAETEKEREQAQKAKKMQEEMKRKAQAQRKAGDLRRSVSMNNLHRRASLPDASYQQLIDLDGDASGCDGATDSANASGYLASGTGGYMAASGNSVGITSTGTTSTAGASFRNLKLPAALQERIQSQVVTSRKFPSAGVSAGAGPSGEKGKEKEQGKRGAMGPPAGIPERPNGMLRKSRSMNTLRLPKREEGCKPGYCESCRTKFDDFKSHVKGRKHRKFAQDDSNFLQLDFLLQRVRRRTIQEVEDEKKEWKERRQRSGSGNSDFGEDDDAEADRFLSQSPQDMDRTIRTWDDGEVVDADGDIFVDLDG